MPRSEITGAELDSASEDWRHECECRWILAMPSREARNAYLEGEFDNFGKMTRKGIKQSRGPDQVERIKLTVFALIAARRRKPAANEPQQSLAA